MSRRTRFSARTSAILLVALLSAHDVGDLLAGRVYVNVHTTLYPSGEIRGDMSETAASAEDEPRASSWSRIKALYE